jgi:hypothetical protein
MWAVNWPLSDTNPRIDQIVVAGYRAMSVAAKLERVRALNQAIQELLLLGRPPTRLLMLSGPPLVVSTIAGPVKTVQNSAMR